MPKPVNPRNKRSPFEKLPQDLEEKFRTCWSDNADRMSNLYTGTPALKTDFTRTGKRTYRGAFNDGINSVTRYYINNFTDGYFCDCLDLMTLKINQEFEIKKRTLLTPMRKQFIYIVMSMLIIKLMLEYIIFPRQPSQPFLNNTEQAIIADVDS